MAELNSPQMNGVGPGGDRRAYFTGADVYGNPMYEWYSAQEDGTADDWEAAEMANIYDWNKSMFNNWYNSPAQLVSRLEEAGMNPLFYLAQNAGNNQAQGPAGASAPNVKHANNKMANILSATKNTADSLLATLQLALDYDIKRRQQEIDLRRVEVEEGRLGNETRKTGQEIEESQSRIQFNAAQIERLGKENEWTDQQIANAQAEIAKMNKEMAAIDASIAETGSRIDLNYATINKMVHENAVLDAQVSELAARTGLEKQQVETEIMKVYELQASANLKSAEIEVQKGQKVVLEKTAEGIEIKNEQDKTYGGWERVQGIIGGYIHSAAEAVNTAINVKTGGAKAALDKAMKTKTEVDTERSKAETEKSKAETEESKSRKELNESKRGYMEELTAQLKLDNFERAQMSGKTAQAYDEAVNNRDEARWMLNNKKLTPDEEKYWREEQRYWEKEIRSMERAHSGGTHVNPTYDFGN